MSLASSLQSLKLSSPFINGSTLSSIYKPISSLPNPNPKPTFLPSIRAMKSMTGRVVSTVNEKTVAVEVVRLAPHPKYKRRVRKKKRYQAHDPDNQFKVGDMVKLEKSKPISKTKSFIAVPVLGRRGKKEEGGGEVGKELGIPLESQMEQQQA